MGPGPGWKPTSQKCHRRGAAESCPNCAVFKWKHGALGDAGGIGGIWERRGRTGGPNGDVEILPGISRGFLVDEACRGKSKHDGIKYLGYLEIRNKKQEEEEEQQQQLQFCNDAGFTGSLHHLIHQCLMLRIQLRSSFPKCTSSTKNMVP